MALARQDDEYNVGFWEVREDAIHGALSSKTVQSPCQEDGKV